MRQKYFSIFVYVQLFGYIQGKIQSQTFLMLITIRFWHLLTYCIVTKQLSSKKKEKLLLIQAVFGELFLIRDTLQNFSFGHVVYNVILPSLKEDLWAYYRGAHFSYFDLPKKLFAAWYFFKQKNNVMNIFEAFMNNVHKGNKMKLSV